MAVTDGTAAFEKRKFADNSKLSVPCINDSTCITAELTIKKTSAGSYSTSTYTLPSDGVVIFAIASTSSNINFYSIYNTNTHPYQSIDTLYSSGTYKMSLASFIRTSLNKKGTTLYIGITSANEGDIENLAGNIYFYPTASAT